MKSKLICAIGLLMALSSQAQQKTSVLVISNKEGKLVVDGTEFSMIKSSETTRLTLEDGDHIIQVKTGDDIQTKTINCSDGKQKVINFEFSAVVAGSVSGGESGFSTVADIQLDLPGTLSEAKTVQKAYSFDEGDEVSFDFDILNKNGTVNIALLSYPDKGMIYSKDKVERVNGEKIRIPKRGVYVFLFSTNHIVNRSAHFVVNRKAGPNSARNFKTNVRVIYDTTHQFVTDQQIVVHSTGNSAGNRTVVTIILPSKTTYWVYWIGVGQESKQNMKKFATGLSEVVSKLAGGDPIVAFGMKLLPELPVFNSTSTVNYRFTDNVNATNFRNGIPNFGCYNFRNGDNVTTDYTLVTTVNREMNLCLWNNNPLWGRDVFVKVEAFIVTPHWVTEEAYTSN